MAVLEGDAFEAFDEGVAHELVYGGLVVVEAVVEGLVADFAALEGIGLGGLAGDLFEVVQEDASGYHFLYGVGAQQVVVDLVEWPGIGAPVAPGPFLGVADGSYAFQVDAGHDPGGVVLFDQVGEGQVGGIGVVDVPPHDEREGSYAGGPEDVGVGGGFGSAFEHALVDGAEFVEVVALVGARPGVHEGEHAGDEQRGFVVGDGEGAGKDGAGFAVFALAVAEEEAVGGGVVVADAAGLPDEGAADLRALVDVCAGGEDKVVADHSVSDLYGGVGIAVDGAVFQSAGAFYVGVVADADVVYGAGVEQGDVCSDGAGAGGVAAGVAGNALFELLDELWPVAVEGDDVGELGG